MADEVAPEVPVAWTAMPYRAPVIERTGAQVGIAESLEGDEDNDIFHGVVVKVEGERGLRELPAARITRITSRAVYTDLGPDELSGLPPFEEERTYHVGWGGLFRKHPKWEQQDPHRPTWGKQDHDGSTRS